MAITFSFRGDEGVVAFTELERPDRAGDAAVVAGGVLGGDEHLVHQVTAILSGMSEQVVVARPNVVYRFSAGRDTAADVAAAMLAVGAGRGQLSERGWQILDAALGVDPDDTADSDTIY